jgi:hypothetical protein
MRTLALSESALGIGIALSLTGCLGAQPPVAVPGTSSLIASSAGAKTMKTGIRSWMATGAGAKDLLYVVIPTVNTQGTVNIYSFPQGTLEGQITDLTNPGGDCSDARGDIYVTDATPSGNRIVEYAHGSTQPTRMLSVPGANPFSCAVDPTNGDLAVTNYGTTQGRGATIAIFHKAKGQPQTYEGLDFLNYAYCSYSRADDLFIDGHYFQGYEVPKFAQVTGKSLLPLDLNYEIGWISSVQWDGRYLAVGQAVKPYIFRFSISGTKGTLVGSTPLTDAYDAFQFVIAGKKAIVANLYYYDRYIARFDVLVYNYPQGGNSTQRIMTSDTGLFSIALSRH